MPTYHDGSDAVSLLCVQCVDQETISLFWFLSLRLQSTVAAAPPIKLKRNGRVRGHLLKAISFNPL